MLVTGPAGIGKSTLAAAARQRFQSAGTMVLEAWCSPGRPTHAPVLEIVQRALQVLGRAGGGDEQALGAWRDSVATLDGQPGAREGQQDRTPEAERISLFDRLSESLRILSEERPLAVLLHDLDLADGGTLDLVRFLGAMLAGDPAMGVTPTFRGLILATACDAASILGEPGWSEQVRLERLELSGLAPDAVQRYLASGEVVNRALEATGGNPRLLDALFRTASERLAHGPRLGEMVNDDPQAMSIMALLAVAARPLGAEDLSALTGLDQGGLSGALALLTSAGLVKKSLVQGDLQLSFAHSGDQSSAYQAIPADQRAELHRQLAAHLQRTGGDRELEARAEHLLSAGDGDEAVELCMEAGQRLEISLSFSRAIELYERALPRCQREDQRIALLDKLCTLHEMTGKLDAALAHVGALARLMPGDVGVALRKASLHLMGSDHAAAAAAVDSVLAGEPQLDAVTGARALSCRAEALFLAGDTAGASEAAIAALDICLANPHEGDLAVQHTRLLNTMARIRMELGDTDGAEQDMARALERARAQGRVAEELRSLGLMGQLAMGRGDHAGAEDWYQQARTLAEAMGEHRLLGVYLQHLAVLSERRRHYGDALAHYQQAVAAFKKVGHRAYLSWVATDLGKLYLDLGDVERAHAMLQLASSLSGGEPPLAARVNMELLAGRIAQLELRVGEARRCFGRARRLADQAGQPERAARAVMALAGLELGRDDPRAALDMMQAPGVLLPEGGALRAEALALMARAELRLGRLERAEARLAELIELGEDLRDREATWQAAFLLARVRAAQDRPAEQLRLLRRAAALARRTREGLPEHLAASLADHPMRAALRRSLSRLEQSPSTPEPGADAPAPAETHTIRPSHGSVAQGRIIGDHPKLLAVLNNVERVAPTDTTVLIRGESGTGKELIATAIHEQSARSSRPMVAVNCGALVESLLLSDLFGHERGAFTGASQRRKGRFEAADSGTIFLDEIGDVSPRTQAALLRVLQEGEVTRVGGTNPIRVDVRVICATNRDLEGMVARGEFREDLYYRLRGVQLHLPALRERSEDIPLLAEHFLGEAGHSRLSDEALALLRGATWQGNVRELKNVLRSAAVLSDREVLEVADFADYPELAALSREDLAADPAVTEATAGDGGAGYLQQVLSSGLSLREFKSRVELECIQDALQETGGNITRAAKLLGVKRPRLSQIIKENGLTLG